jgi:hypothetical protein
MTPMTPMIVASTAGADPSTDDPTVPAVWAAKPTQTRNP